MVRLLLIRHGATAWTATGRFQGQTDVPLSPLGQQQVAALAQRLRPEPLDQLYASDLQRAWATAQALAAPPALVVRPEPRLREIAFGAWEGLTYAEIQQRHASALAAWERDPYQVAPPDGETLTQINARVCAVYASLRAVTASEQTIALVAHGGPLQLLLCCALGLAPHAYWQFTLAPASISTLSLAPQGAMITALNDTHHLHGLL